LRSQEEIPWIVETNMFEGLPIQPIEAPVTGASRIFSKGVTTEFANKSDFVKIFIVSFDRKNNLQKTVFLLFLLAFGEIFFYFVNF
jgi:hypothetical protein